MAQKPPLGRGLQALIPTGGMEVFEKKTETGETTTIVREVATGATGTIGKIEVALVRPNPFQPRVDFDPVALEELKNSIIEKGVIQPITVRKTDSGYELISGERRLRASTLAGIKEIPAYILDIRSDREMLELALIENVQREKLNPIEIANGYKRLMEECGLTQEQISQRVGKDRSTVTNFLRLLKLPNDILQSLRIGEITMGHARALLALESTRKQLEIWKQTLEQQHSVRKVEQLVGKAVREAAIEKGEKPQPKLMKGAESAAEYENLLRQKLATKIKINHTAKGNGEIVIEYFSTDELDRIVEAISSIPQ
ncbi:MAG: ParB/RepB/Spo0J family partition protein [Chloroherpetonaceae bacterium]|nr:ParB/RepB/Spo0J family partition protein [Chloroherpetonaceae bacterium]